MCLGWVWGGLELRLCKDKVKFELDGVWVPFALNCVCVGFKVEFWLNKVWFQLDFGWIGFRLDKFKVGFGLSW